jgi:hypothetical protein
VNEEATVGQAAYNLFEATRYAARVRMKALGADENAQAAPPASLHTHRGRAVDFNQAIRVFVNYHSSIACWTKTRVVRIIRVTVAATSATNTRFACFAIANVIGSDFIAKVPVSIGVV